MGHACVLIENNGIKLITDPWFGYAFHYNTFHAFPPFIKPDSDVLDKIDIIHISHIHNDHFCKQSLSFFKKDIPIAIANYKNKFFLNEIISLGFTNIIEIPEGNEGARYRNFNLKTVITPEEKNFDSALIISDIDRKEHFYLNNDCYISIEQFQNLKHVVARFKGCFLGYSPVNPYPTCYDNTKLKNVELSKMDVLSLIETEQRKYVEYAIKICKEFKTEWLLPYSNNLRLLNTDLFHHNRIFSDIQLFDSYQSDFLLLNDVTIGSEISESGVVLKKEKVMQEKIENYKQIPFFETYSDDQIHDYQSKIECSLNEFMRKVSLSWKSPMIIQFVILGERKKIELNYHHLVENVDRDPDLIVEYRFSDLKRLCENQYSFVHLHYMFRFNAIIINYIHNQSVVHKWGL